MSSSSSWSSPTVAVKTTATRDSSSPLPSSKRVRGLDNAEVVPEDEVISPLLVTSSTSSSPATRSSARRKDPNTAVRTLSDLIRINKNVVFLTGAGLSCASGIPPFRGSRDAIWTKSVYEWGTKERFLKDPLEWYREFFLRHFTVVYSAQPNAAHVALSRICAKFPATCRVITQNVDMLHTHPAAPIPAGQLIEVHGRVDHFKCFTEGCPFSTKESVVLTTPITSEQDVPRCPNCGAICCPNTLLFDEHYSDHALYQFDKALEWLVTADVIVFVGTSFQVGITNFAFEAVLAHEQGVATGVSERFLFNFNISDNVPRLSKGIKTPVHSVKGLCELTLPLLAEYLEDKTT